MLNKKCKICETDFVANHNRTQYCSDNCRKAATINSKKKYFSSAKGRETWKNYVKNYQKERLKDPNIKAKHHKSVVNYQAKRRREDTNYVILVNHRRNLRDLNPKKVKFTNKKIKWLGCTKKEFFTYIESLFQPGMNWDNRGRNGWVYDHIKPLCSFNLLDEEEQLKAFHYTNIQPLWDYQNVSKAKLDNLRKGDKNE